MTGHRRQPRHPRRRWNPARSPCGGPVFVLVRAIMARNVTLIVTSAAGLAAILLAAFFGSGFTSKLTDGYSPGMAMATALALACYAVGLFAATAQGNGP